MPGSLLRRLAVLSCTAALACGGGGSTPRPPAAPTDLRVSGATGLTVHLAWTDASTNETGFELERTADGVDWTPVATPVPDATSHDDTVPGTSLDFSYRIRAVNDQGASEYSDTVEFFRPNLVFVTSTTYQPGALGGLAGADTICQGRASAAGLAGTYRAWLSTDAVNAVDRLAGARGWARPDGKPVADELADLASEQLMYPPRVDELGNDLLRQWVVTGTRADGTRHGTYSTCGNWAVVDGSAVAMGSSSAGTGGFTYGPGVTFCNDQRSIYCFGIDNAVEVSPAPVNGRLAFQTLGAFTPGGGVAAADALCAAEASDAGVAGSFKALLALNGAPASSRFDTNGLPWVRADGLPLAPTAAALFTAEYLDVSFDMDATGTQRFTQRTVWSGTATWGSAGTTDTTCDDYEVTAGFGRGGWSGETRTYDAFTQHAVVPCDSSFARLACLEE